jgi:hypothetical protein
MLILCLLALSGVEGSKLKTIAVAHPILPPNPPIRQPKFLIALTKRTTVEKSEAVRIAQKAGLDVRAAFMDVFILFIFFLSFKFFYFQTKKGNQIL